MLKLKVLQAEFGDCLILQYGALASPRYALIDGGPAGVYSKHLRAELERIRQSGAGLDFVLLSHIDNDHILGLLEMMVEIAECRSAGADGAVAVASLWHNAFDLVEGGGDAFEQLSFALYQQLTWGASMPAAGELAFGIQEGQKLLVAQQELNFPLNPGFPGGVILTDTAPRPVQMKGVDFWVLGPSRKNLSRLRKQWLSWLKRAAGAPFADPIEAEKVDRSVPNLSSIMLLAVAGKRKILLTGDGVGDDVLDGLQETGRLDPDGRLHVNILKLPHHGSVRNINRAFFERIPADTYVVSANGKYNNPDLATLIWLVEAAHKQNRKIRIVATNPTEATYQLVENYPPARLGYRIDYLKAGASSITV